MAALEDVGIAFIKGGPRGGENAERGLDADSETARKRSQAEIAPGPSPAAEAAEPDRGCRSSACALETKL